MPIRKRGKAYQVDVHVRGMRARQTARTYAEARALEADLRQELIERGRTRPAEHSIADALARWLREEAPTLKSHRKFISHARHLRPFVAGYALTDAPKAAEDMKREMRGALSPATINRRLAILRRILNIAYKRWGWLSEPLGLKIEMLPENGDRHVYLTPDEVETLAAACTPQAGDVIRFAAYTGLRRGEILRLEERHIADGCVVLDGQTKSGRPRVIPIPKGCPIPVPLTISDAQLRKQFDAARTATGMTHIRFHDLRHTYASWLVQAGASMTAVRDLLGHANLSVTDRYSHLATSHLREAVGRLSMRGHRHKSRHKIRN